MFDPELHLKIKHAEECLEVLVGERKFNAWLDGFPADYNPKPSEWYQQTHREILQIRASAIDDTSRREIVIISQYFPHLGINAR